MVIVVSAADVCEDDARADAGFWVSNDCDCAAGYATHGCPGRSSPIAEFCDGPFQFVEVDSSVEADSIVVPTCAAEKCCADAVRFLWSCVFAVSEALMRESPANHCEV